LTAAPWSLHGKGSEPSALACQTATIREARLWVYNTPPHENRLLHGPRVEIRRESETVAYAHECLPEFVDPRGP
jgi:hypothetical protein